MGDSSRRLTLGEVRSHAEGETAEHHPSEHSLWPAVSALGILLVAVGLLHQPLIVLLGGIVILASAIGWLWQPWEGQS